MSNYEELAARRFRQYKWERRKVDFDKTIVKLVLKALPHFARAFNHSGLSKRRPVDKISVE